MDTASRILIVDDDAAICTSLPRALSCPDLEVRAVGSAESALSGMTTFAPDIVLSDVRMPGMDGVALLELLRARAPDIDVVLMSAYEDLPTVAAAMRAGAADFLVKPLDLHQLRRLIARLLEDRHERQALTQPAPAAAASNLIVGRTPAMIDVFKQVGRAARGRATVLLRGESGTGKELVARAIHETSAFAAEPFVALNCAAIPATLLESELFGHVRGAFTGATADRRGKFALAGRGTLLLDEIGDMTEQLQAKLLRVLQEQEFQPVGAERTERSEARVVAATHRNLEAMVRRGEFREDLYYRLRVVEIRVPPLRERIDDLPLLVDHLLHRVARIAGRDAPRLAPDALAALAAHDWPGNIRELEHCLLRAMTASPGDVLRAEHLQVDSGGATAAPRTGTLAEVERAHVLDVFTNTGGHKARTARILGVSRPRLDRLLRRHGIDPNRLPPPEG